MKDLLTTAASIIIILFCFSLLFLSEREGTHPVATAQLTNPNTEVQNGHAPPVKSTLFTRVQSVKVQKGVLMFVTIEHEKLQEHYFLIRDKNVILVKTSRSDMPSQSIKFEDAGNGTMRVMISDTIDIDLMKELTANGLASAPGNCIKHISTMTGSYDFSTAFPISNPPGKSCSHHASSIKLSKKLKIPRNLLPAL
ncbi:hypothetical protein [uncultured Gimesia sp.]|uniref:hypothetical protein n=1 Tax=uncultured Gimesia sp. TaxID=1678688 RepID=UPI00260472FC|nr:hypothetical protein [uncultured Gimesia sp.]